MTGFKLLLTISLAILTSCHAALNGDLKVYNDSNLPLTIEVWGDGNTDTLNFIVPPGGEETVLVICCRGNKKRYDCCPCEFTNMDIETANGGINKDPNNRDNWVISNKENLKKWGGEEIRCEFRVTQSDI